MNEEKAQTKERFQYRGGETPEIGDLVCRKIYKERNPSRRKEPIIYYGIVVGLHRRIATELPVIKWIHQPAAKPHIPHAFWLKARAIK